MEEEGLLCLSAVMISMSEKVSENLWNEAKEEIETS